MSAVIDPRQPEQSLAAWRQALGDQTYAVDWDLRPESVVLEVGGFEGRWARQIAERYSPRLFVFEPQRWAFERCRQTLASFPNVRLLNYGLGERNAELPMGDFFTDGCSFLKGDLPGRDTGTGELREAGQVWNALGITAVDLMLVNIEGYEYVLLPHLIERGLLARVKWLMVQCHMFADPDGTQYRALRERIGQTHRILWDFGTTLAAWERLTP